MPSFVHVTRDPSFAGHPLATALVMHRLQSMRIGSYWGFETEKENTVLLVKRLSNKEFALAVCGAGRELRLDLVNTAQKVSDTFARLNPSVKIRFIP